MSIIDDRGRVGGRINLIDAIVAAVIVMLIPTAYGAYLLFRTPPAKLTAIRPPKIYAGGTTRIEIEGRDLRPFMRVSFNDVQGRTFLIGSTTSAQIDLPDLNPGTYDVVLYDYAREIDRLPKAFTVLPIAPLPTITVELSGVFMGLSDSILSRFTAGGQLPTTARDHAEIVGVGEPVPAQLRVRAGASTLPVTTNQKELPATIRVACSVTSNPDGTVGCTVHGPQQQTAIVAPDSVLSLPGPDGWILFQIRTVHVASPAPVSEARVRFVVPAEALGAMKPGDVDGVPTGTPASHQATLVAIVSSTPIAAADAGPAAPLGGNLRAVDATVRLPLDASSGQWSYRGAPVKIGAPFAFETSRYIARGTILSMTPPTAASAGTAR